MSNCQIRILIAIHGFPPTHNAGAERQAQRMATWLHQQGHDVEVLAFESLSAPEFKVETSQDDEGYMVHRLYDHIDYAEGLHKTYDNPAVGKALRDILSAKQFDLIHVVSGYLLAGQVVHTAHEFGIPVSISPMEYWFLCARLNLIKADGTRCIGPESDQKCARCLLESKRRYRLPAAFLPALLVDTFWSVSKGLPFATLMAETVAERRINLQTTLAAADLVVCHSQTLIDMFTRYGFDTKKFVFARQGLHKPETFPPPSTAPSLRFVYMGQIQPHKGVDLLIDATVRLLAAGNDLRLDIWGSETQAPNYVAELKARSQTYPSIRWQGEFLGEKVWSILADNDVLVIPSRWHENSPNVILEAFTMGLPVIGTRLGGMEELIQHEQSGLLFTLNDSRDLSAQMQRLIDDPSLLEKLRESIPYVKTIDDEMQELMALYVRLLDKQAVR